MAVFSHVVERRQFGRRRTNVQGLISLRGRIAMGCIVRNLSQGGALLEVTRPEFLPGRFRLLLEAASFETDCEVVRRSPNGIGVRFLTPCPATL